MIKLEKIKRTKRELKYIDIIAYLMMASGRFADGGLSLSSYEMFGRFKLSNYDINLIKKVLVNLNYFTL